MKAIFTLALCLALGTLLGSALQWAGFALPTYSECGEGCSDV
jgi:Na+/glutamate symporter